MTRRAFLSFSLRSTAFLAAASLVPTAAACTCPFNRKQIILRGLPPSFDGFRVALLADLHHGRWNSQNYLHKVVNMTNAGKPDLIALVGDLIDCGGEWVPTLMQELSRLRAPSGVVAVLGNHDHSRNAAPIMRDGLRRAGIADLTNTNLPLRRNGETFFISGVGDLWRERQKLTDALRGVRGVESSLLLSHNPDYVESIQDERVGLMLSGHTHGGQCVFPIIGAPIVPSKYGQKYLHGLCQGPLARVFVSRGVGCSFPVRINAPAEVSLLTLRCGNTA